VQTRTSEAIKMLQGLFNDIINNLRSIRHWVGYRSLSTTLAGVYPIDI